MDIQLEKLRDEDVLALSVEQPSVFEALVKKYQDAFLRASFKIVKNKEEAEDIVQESFTKIYFNANKFKEVDGASFKSWAYKIVINTSLSHYKKLKKVRESTVYFDSLFYEESFGYDDGLEFYTDIKLLVSRVLSEMPNHLRGVVKKYYLEDKSQEIIANEENVSVATIKMCLFRARKMFKKILDSKQNFSWTM